MPKVEKLDIRNVIEIQDIRKLLINQPSLLTLFEVLCIHTNNVLNEEKASKALIDLAQEAAAEALQELEEDPVLSDHSSDED